MKLKKILFILSLLFLLTPITYAQTELIAGITPDTPLWWLDTVLEKLQLRLITEKDEQAIMQLQIAQERVLELKTMVDAGKIEEAKEAKRAYHQDLREAREIIREIQPEVSTQHMIKIANLEAAVQQHADAVESIADTLAIEQPAKIPSYQQEFIKETHADLSEQTIATEQAIEEKRDALAEKAEQETGMTSREIEQKFVEIEEIYGVQKEERAEVHIELSESKIAEAVESEEVSSETLIEAKETLTEAKIEFEEGNYLEAKGLAREARNILSEEYPAALEPVAPALPLEYQPGPVEEIAPSEPVADETPAEPETPAIEPSAPETPAEKSLEEIVQTIQSLPPEDRYDYKQTHPKEAERYKAHMESQEQSEPTAPSEPAASETPAESSTPAEQSESETSAEPESPAEESASEESAPAEQKESHKQEHGNSAPSEQITNSAVKAVAFALVLKLIFGV